MKWKLALLAVTLSLSAVLTACSPGSEVSRLPEERAEEDAPSSAGVSQEEQQSPDEQPPRTVRLDGRLYYETGPDEETNQNGISGAMSGEFDSTVDPMQLPEQDNQSNFGVGFGYQRLDDYTIRVLIEETWFRFQQEGEVIVLN